MSNTPKNNSVDCLLPAAYCQLLFEKSKIKNNFNKANSYNQNAILQKIVAKNLVELSKNKISKAENILDLGAGTGFVAEEILNNFKHKKIFELDFAKNLLKKNQLLTNKINADIEQIPFKKNVFDLALSSLSLQWMNDLEETIKQILFTLKNGSNFCFSIIGAGSLEELKTVNQNYGEKLSINQFISKSELEKILSELNVDYEIKYEEIILEYDDVYHLLKSIKSIGAGYSKNKKVLKKLDFEKINSFYLKNFNLNNKVPATWQIFYVIIK